MNLAPNNDYPGRISSKNIKGEGKVCWICLIRVVDPTWRPGKPVPGEFAWQKKTMV